MNAPLDKIVIVLYQPQDVVNVAAIIRVMSNFGLTHLRLVEPAAFDPYRIEGIAHHTERLIAATRRYPTLSEALEDCTFVLGTTGRPRQAHHHVLAPRQAAPLLLETARLEGKVAILFGREQDGLPNEALDRCHGVLTIPTHPGNRSLNLAQAALVVAYELWMAFSDPTNEAPPALAPASGLASGRELETLFAGLRELLLALYPYTTETRLDRSLSRLRTMLMRAAPTSEETEAMINLCRHIIRRLRG